MSAQVESIMKYHLETMIETFRWNAGSSNYDGLAVRYVKECLATGYENSVKDCQGIIEKTKSRKTKAMAKEFMAKLQARIDAASKL